MSGQETRATVDISVAAQRLGVNKLTLYDAIRRGDSPVPVIRIGRRILVPTAALEELLQPGASEVAE